MTDERRRASLAAHVEAMGYELAAKIIREDRRAYAEVTSGRPSTRDDLAQAFRELLAGDLELVILSTREQAFPDAEPLEELPGMGAEA